MIKHQRYISLTGLPLKARDLKDAVYAVEIFSLLPVAARSSEFYVVDVLNSTFQENSVFYFELSENYF